jgi:hypothetical protein
VAPRRAEPFHRAPVPRVLGDDPEGVDHVVQTRLAKPVQQRARVLEHHPRLGSLLEELGHDLAHPLVATNEHRGVVVVSDLRVLQHVLQVADDRGGPQVGAAGGDQRLVHVQRDRAGAADAPEIHRRLAPEHRRPRTRLEDGGDPVLDAADGGQVVRVFVGRAHGIVPPALRERIYGNGGEAGSCRLPPAGAPLSMARADSPSTSSTRTSTGLWCGG